MKTHVLISTSIVVEVEWSETSIDSPVASPQIETISNQLSASIKRAFADAPDVEVPEVIVTECLEDANSGRCCRCDAWVSDLNRPDHLRELSAATVLEDGLVCEQCRVWGPGGSKIDGTDTGTDN